MQLIAPAASLFDDVVGKQVCVEEDSYRLMTYVMQCPVDDGVLLYHTLTCCLLHLTTEEAANLTTLQELKDRWFLVPKEFDDRRLCKQTLQMVALFKLSAKYIADYSILTTTGCNARCFYCYEKGTKPVTMTAETATKVGRFIRSHRGEEEVSIRWFGGEPLFNMQVIDQISSDLSSHNVPFSAKMISNGYLFDAAVVQRAKDLWRLKEVQITLDGLESTYNRVKRFIYGKGNAFERVLHNIGLLTDDGIKVLVRLNVDRHNIEEMAHLVSLLHQRFDANEHLSVYSRELYGERSPEERAALYAKRMQLEQLIADVGYGRHWKLQKDFKLNLCMADSDQSVLISPDGHLGKCNHYFDRDLFGHIDSEERDEATIRRFKERPADIEACATCPYYPQCIRLNICEKVKCNPEHQQERLHDLKAAMKDEYEKYLINNMEHETEI